MLVGSALFLPLLVCSCQSVDKEALAEEIRAEIEPQIRREIEAELEKKMREEIEAKISLALDRRLTALGLQEPGWRPPPSGVDASDEASDETCEGDDCPDEETAPAGARADGTPTKPTNDAVDGADDGPAAGRDGGSIDDGASGSTSDADTGPIAISRVVIARGIERREPVDLVDSVAANGQELYCFVEVNNAAGPERTLQAVWLRGDQEHRRIQLDVGRSPTWRTWSRIAIPEGTAGQWRCAILAADNTLIGQQPFTVFAPLDEDADAQ